MKKIILICSILFTSLIYAQVDFLTNQILTNSDITGAIGVMFEIDIDGDGDLDIMFSSKNIGRIGWYENIDSQGSFGDLNIIYDEGDGIHSLVYGDIDNDGDLDLVATQSATYEIFWFEKLEGSNFGEKQVITTEMISPGQLFLADVNSDDLLDIVISHYFTSISWIENIDGSGLFGPRNAIDTNIENVTSIFLADLDGDNDLDLIANTSEDDLYVKVLWYENTDGLGGFYGTEQEVYNFTPEPNYSIVSEVHAADMDGDLDQDIVFAINDEIKWLENIDGQGNFPINHLIHQIGYRERYKEIDIGDLDNDGDLDLATVSTQYQDPDALRTHINEDGLGNFSDGNLIDESEMQLLKVKITDIDNNGINDLVVGANYSPNLIWYSQETINNFSDLKEISIYWQGVYGLDGFDVDTDGDIDIIGIIDNAIIWYENKDGNGDMGFQQVIGYTYGSSPRLYIGDLNGDNLKDLLIGGFNTTLGYFEWYANDGQGNFEGPNIITTEQNNPIIPAIGDINGDQFNDIVIVRVNNNTVQFGYHLSTDGNGNFEPFVFFNSLINSSGLVELNLYDIDGDNDLDILYTIRDTDNGYGRLAWLENTDGLGNFSDEIVISSQAATHVKGVDMDNDNDLDLVVSSDEDIRVVWFENMDGLGNFGPPITIDYNSGSSTPRGLEVSDIDGDGDFDVLLTSSNQDNLYWFENLDGEGEFNYNSHVIFEYDNDASYVLTADFDNDNDNDILMYSFLPSNRQLLLLENQGISSNRIQGSVKFDLDNDGCDSNDFSLANIRVKTTNGSETLETFTYQNGAYQLFPVEEGEYITEVASIPQYFNVDPLQHLHTITGINNTVVANFCLDTTETINDLNITLQATTLARPGFEASYVIMYHNVGYTNLSGSIVIDFNGAKLDFLNSNATVASETSESLSFNYEDFAPLETRVINLTFQVLPPPDVENGDILEFIATINPINGDLTETDNIFYLQQIIVGSYDPNDISVAEGESIFIDETDDFLHYIIRFQNMGTASAVNIVVENDLDENLDWSTLTLENISHQNRVEIRNGNNISFIFEDIYLPHSDANEPESHGYIAYKIKPKPNIEIGEIMTNKADIYFDFNPAIQTNTVTTTVVEDLSINNNKINKIKIFPNPTKGLLNVVTNGSIIENITIISLQGMVLKNVSYKNDIDVSRLSTGIYFIQVTVDGIKVTKRFIKE